LRYYSGEIHTVWPSVVAVLAGNDEKTALSVLPLFRDLAPVADELTPEMVLLFREPNVAYAARAVIGLWRLNRLPVIASELRELVLASADATGRGWVLLQAIAQRAQPTHGLLAALAELFADTPEEMASRVTALLYPEIPAEEAAIQAHVPLRGGDPATAIVNWDGIYNHVCAHEHFGLLFLALMCEFGSGNVTSQKIRLIKHQRSLTQTNLADSKSIVERAMNQLVAGASQSEKRACVRAYFRDSVSCPKAILDLLAHANGWYRWAGLVLLDAWGAPDRVGSLIQDRLQDRSELVRAQAIRMNHG
jgi:hypothetical protein